MKKKIKLSFAMTLGFLGLGATNSLAVVEYEPAGEIIEYNKKEISSFFPIPKNGQYQEIPVYSTTPNVHLITGEYGKELNGFVSQTLMRSDDFLSLIDKDKEFEITMYNYNVFPGNGEVELSLRGLLDCKEKRTGKGYFYALTREELDDIQSELVQNGQIVFPERMKNKLYKSTLTCKINDPSLKELNITKEEFYEQENSSQADRNLLDPFFYDINKSLRFVQNTILNYDTMLESKDLKDNAFIGYELKQDNKVKWSQVTDVFVLGKEGLGTEEDKTEILEKKDDWYDNIQDQINEIVEKEKPKTEGNQEIKANILNGGITGGIVSPNENNGLSIQDIDFGQLKIGQVIQPINKESMLSVRDWTGGNGWKLTAKHKNLERNQSLQLAVQIENESVINLNDTENLVTSGQSQFETTTKSGEYSAKWGTHPTAGEFNNVIEWNLSANVTE